jgi:hypothetical protein
MFSELHDRVNWSNSIIDGANTHMSVDSDIDKNTTVGKPDGPLRFVESLGMDVPTYIDPRDDLKMRIGSVKKGTKTLDYHIPFKMRGMYRPDQLPVANYNQRRGRIKVNLQGFVLCDDNSASGLPCANPAVNRSPRCRSHGGALHPCDKKLSPASNQLAMMASQEGAEAIAKLDRVQRFMQGFLTVEELDDDEIVGGYVRDSNGQPISNQRIGVRFQTDMVKELARRMNKFMQMKLPNMLKVVTDIAESDIVEPQDRLKAAFWAAERVLGKTPDVVIHGQTGKPYESVFENLESGSRESYRVSSQRAIESDESILDAEEVEYDESEDDTDSQGSVAIRFEGNQDDAVYADSLVESETTVSNVQVETEDQHIFGENDYSIQPADKVQKYITLEQHRAEVKAKRDRIKKAKSRRFAARAAGVPTVANTPWLVDWRARKGGLWCAKIIAADQQTPALLAKLEAKKLENQI